MKATPNSTTSVKTGKVTWTTYSHDEYGRSGYSGSVVLRDSSYIVDPALPGDRPAFPTLGQAVAFIDGANYAKVAARIGRLKAEKAQRDGSRTREAVRELRYLRRAIATREARLADERNPEARDVLHDELAELRGSVVTWEARLAKAREYAAA